MSDLNSELDIILKEVGEKFNRKQMDRTIDDLWCCSRNDLKPAILKLIEEARLEELKFALSNISDWGDYANIKVIEGRVEELEAKGEDK